MNWFMALNVVCCEPVADSPEAWDRPLAFSEKNAAGMPPVELKKLVSALPTPFWLPLRPPGAGSWKFNVRFK